MAKILLRNPLSLSFQLRLSGFLQVFSRIQLPKVIFPFEVWEISQIVIVEVEEIVCKLFGRREVVDVDVRLGRRHLGVVAGAHHDGDDGKIHDLAASISMYTRSQQKASSFSIKNLEKSKRVSL